VRIAFLDCELDSGTRRLLRAGVPAPLSPKALQLLELLVERRPNVVTKAEIQERLWPDTFVVDTNVHNLVAEIRAALGDDPRQARYVRTAARQGYAFEAPVCALDGVAAAPVAFHWLLRYGREVRLPSGRNLIGRGGDTTITIDHLSVSRHHAALTVAGGEASIEDLGSKNGTLVNGMRVEGVVHLQDLDEIRVGKVKLVYRCGPFESTQTLGSRDE
jgi:DNA-binding winged helix-turn-helix (wHTH) protein